MARKFVTQREHDFIARVGKEAVQKIIGQEVVYYPISRDATVPHDIYGESIDKSWDPPVRLNAVVDYDNPSVSSKAEGLDSEYSLELYVLRIELVERNLVPREGDFLEYGQTFYEVTGVTEPRLVFGQINNKFMVRLACVASREGTFAAEAYSSHEVSDGSHPVTAPRSRNVSE